jgi:hypothetical protein
MSLTSALRHIIFSSFFPAFSLLLPPLPSRFTLLLAAIVDFIHYLLFSSKVVDDHGPGNDEWAIAPPNSVNSGI